ncbi:MULTISPECIES: helix-turn-helix domain-containing protein [unclassified Mesorhizobium]|uniref:helix-turn-helix domain-containing protein n=1 Tax=unclassified Mesorhizobium TaxID=325217 RepID=UPI00333AEEE2
MRASPRQVERLAKSYFHMPPTRYYLKIRLEKAQALLGKTNMKVLDVALATGFKSHSYLSHCYGNEFDAIPSDARRAACLARLV